MKTQFRPFKPSVSSYPQKQNLLKLSEYRVSSLEEFSQPCSWLSLFENSLLEMKKTVIEHGCCGLSLKTHTEEICGLLKGCGVALNSQTCKKSRFFQRS